MACGSEKAGDGMRVSPTEIAGGGRVICLVLALLLLAGTAAAQQFPVEHHRSWWWNRGGSLEVTEGGLHFVPRAKEKATASAAADGDAVSGDSNAVVLPWEAIQQLELAQKEIRVVTYEDQRWQLGRDRHLRFILLSPEDDQATPEPADLAEPADFAGLAQVLREALGLRLVNTLAGGMTDVQWRVPAKRSGVPRGVEGTLAFTGSEVVFESETARESRRWPLEQIDTVASAGPLSLTVTARERAVADQGGYRSFQFQLKQPLQPEQYRKLWQAIETAHGLRLRYHAP